MPEYTINGDMEGESSLPTAEAENEVLNYAELVEKRKKIEIACELNDTVGLAQLSATREGFIDDELRSRACKVSSFYTLIDL